MKHMVEYLLDDSKPQRDAACQSGCENVPIQDLMIGGNSCDNKEKKKLYGFVQRVQEENGKSPVKARDEHKHRHNRKQSVGRDPKVMQNELVPLHHIAGGHYIAPAANLQSDRAPGA